MLRLLGAYSLSQIPIMDIHRVEVVESRVDLTLNPRTISLSLENPLQAESFVALINSYAMLSPRLDRSYSLCFKGIEVFSLLLPDVQSGWYVDMGDAGADPLIGRLGSCLRPRGAPWGHDKVLTRKKKKG